MTGTSELKINHTERITELLKQISQKKLEAELIPDELKHAIKSGDAKEIQRLTARKSELAAEILADNSILLQAQIDKTEAEVAEITELRREAEAEVKRKVATCEAEILRAREIESTAKQNARRALMEYEGLGQRCQQASERRHKLYEEREKLVKTLSAA